MPPVAKFKLKEPLPKYRSTEILVKNLIDYILTGGFKVGSKFLSDSDIVSVTGRSRTAVRRALNIMQDEGWILRKGGKGTFVGPRLEEHLFSGDDQAAPESPESPLADISLRRNLGDSVKRKSEDSLIRIAVAAAGLANIREGHNWYYGEILQGIDEAASEKNIIVEFLGYHGTRQESLSQRLVRSRPDVFLCIGPPLNHVSLFGLASRWHIPCVLAATRAPELNIPNFYEDSVSASQEAVRYLAELGHRRIGFIQVMSPSGWWTFDRYKGYVQGMEECCRDEKIGEGPWLPLEPDTPSLDRVRRYLAREKISAVICGSFWAARYLAELIQARELQVPRDLSCIVFDQSPIVSLLLGGVKPTTVHLPLKDLGRSFVQCVHRIVNREEVPLSTVVPCRLVPGESTIPFVG